MSVICDVLNDVIDMAQATNPYANIMIGSMPINNGISISIASGVPETVMQDKSMAYQLTLVLNGKHEEQETVSETLCAIHDVLVKCEDYPNTRAYQITNIMAVSAPHYIGRENKQWLYGSSLRVNFYYR